MSLPLEPSQISELVKLQVLMVRKGIAYWIKRIDREHQATQTHILDEPWLIEKGAATHQALCRLLTRAASFPDTCEEGAQLALLMDPYMRMKGLHAEWRPILEPLMVTLFDFAQLDPTLRSRVWQALGLTYQQLGDDRRASSCYRSAEEDSLGYSGEATAELLVQLRQQQAAILARQSQPQSASDAIQIALSILSDARQLNVYDPYMEAQARVTMAYIYLQSYQADLVFEHAQQAYALLYHYDGPRDGLQDGPQNGPQVRRDLARALHYLGDSCRIMGVNLDRADFYLRKAEALVKSMKDITWLAQIKDAQAQVARKRGDYQVSIALAQEAIQAFETVGDRRSRVSCMHSLGLTLSYAGEYDRAEDMLRQASSGWAELGVELERVNALYALAYMYYTGPKNMENARKTVNEAITLAHKADPSPRRDQLIRDMEADFPGLCPSMEARL